MPQVVRNLRFKHPTMKQRLEEILYLDAKSRIDLPPGQKPVLTDRQIALSASYINALSQHAFHHPEHASLLVDDRYVNGVTSKTMFCLLALAFRLEPEDPNESCGYPEEDEMHRAERIARFGPGALYEVEVIETMAACQEFATYRVVDDVPEKAMTGYEDGKYPRGRCIYVIECRTGRIKIGVSKQPRQRIRGLLSTGGVQHDAIHVSGAFLNATEVEAIFKREFADLKIEGEWFDTTAPKAIEFLLSQFWRLDTLADAESDAVGDRVRSEARDAWIHTMFHRSNVAA